jgi:hypothetical protein
MTLNQARTSSVMVDGTTVKGGVSLLLSPVNRLLGTEFFGSLWRSLSLALLFNGIERSLKATKSLRRKQSQE